MVGKSVHGSATELVRYREQHLSNGDYHLEEGKVQGEFVGALAQEWGLNAKPIVDSAEKPKLLQVMIGRGQGGLLR